MSVSYHEKRCRWPSPCKCEILHVGLIHVDNSLDPQPGATTSAKERRSLPRFFFVATAQIADPDSTVRVTTRISEISRNGCYVDSINSMPVGTLLNIRIERDQGTFVTNGKIIYVHERIGMGVLFLDPAPDQLQLLDLWLSELPPASNISK